MSLSLSPPCEAFPDQPGKPVSPGQHHFSLVSTMGPGWGPSSGHLAGSALWDRVGDPCACREKPFPNPRPEPGAHPDGGSVLGSCFGAVRLGLECYRIAEEGQGCEYQVALGVQLPSP